MRQKFLWIMMLLSSLILAACASSPSTAPPTVVTVQGEPIQDEGGTYMNTPPNVLAEMLKNKDFVFVNTHIPYEGEIERTDQFIAFEENGPQRVNEYPADKTAKIVLYCRSGRMSATVAQELVKAGYTNVWNLDGGMVAWEQAGYLLINK